MAPRRLQSSGAAVHEFNPALSMRVSTVNVAAAAVPAEMQIMNAAKRSVINIGVLGEIRMRMVVSLSWFNDYFGGAASATGCRGRPHVLVVSFRNRRDSKLFLKQGRDTFGKTGQN